MSHEPTFHHTGRSHWASCSCGWRSSLMPDEFTCQRAFTSHVHEENR